MIDAAESFQKLHAVVPAQFMFYCQTSQHIDGVEPTLVAVVVSIQVAFLADAGVRPKGFKVETIHEVAFITSLIPSFIPFSHIDNSSLGILLACQCLAILASGDTIQLGFERSEVGF